MNIKWFGQSFFEIITDTDTKKGVKIYFDPYSESIGIVPPKELVADVVTISHSHSDHNNTKIFQEAEIIINTAGEYSVKGVDIKGIKTFHDNNQGADKGINIAYLLESENIRLLHLGDLGHPLEENLVRIIDGVDILMIPVGGQASITPKEAVKIIKQIEPKIAIPMHYKIPGIEVELGDLDSFCKEMGICATEPVSSLSLKAGNLMGKEMEIVVMEAQKK